MRKKILEKFVSISDIKMFAVDNACDRLRALNAIINYVEIQKHDLEVIYLISSLELYGFADKLIFSKVNFLKKNYPNIKIVILSVGCVSFYGGLLEFIASNYQRGALVIIEGKRSRLQHVINCLGFGSNNKEEELTSQEGYSICTVIKNAQIELPGMIWINHIHILSRAEGKNTLINTALKLHNYLNAILSNRKQKIISFENNTNWSKNLLLILSKILLAESSYEYPLQWAVSIEKKKKHFHSLKPLYEIQKYFFYSGQGQSIVVLTLGSGGRIGIAGFSPYKVQLSMPTKQTKVTITQFTHAEEERTENKLARYVNQLQIDQNNVYEQLYSIHRKYEFIDNLYFEWPLY